MKTNTIRAAVVAALTIAASAVFPSSSFASGANLITNGDFETRMGSGNLSGNSYGYANQGNANIPTDWVLSGTTSHLGLRLPGGTGGYAFMFENPGTTDTVSQSFDVLYRGTYKLSFKHGIYSSTYGSTTTKATLTPSGGSATQIGNNWTPSATENNYITTPYSATTAVIAPQTYTLTFVPVSNSPRSGYAYSIIDDVVFALDTLVLEDNEEISASTAIAPDAITLGADATLNLTLATTSESMSGTLVLGAGSKIVLTVPDATAGRYTFATGGITLPSGASDASAFFTAPAGYEIGFANNGATLNVMKPTIVAIAEWNGNVGGGGFQDPANWTCYSAGGSLIENGVPGEDTVKYILDADADWTATNLTFAAGVTLDLNGHKLYTTGTGLSGSAGPLGTDDYVTNGSFEQNSNTGNSYLYGATATGWTGTTGIDKGRTFKAVNAPHGSAVWFFQGNSQASTTVNVPESGFYTVTFYYGARSGHAGGVIHLDVGVVQDYIIANCTSTAATQATVPNVFFKKGDNTLTFRHTFTSGDICSWIDVVTVKRETSPVVCDSSADAANPGELHVAVGENTEATIGGTTLCICDNLRIVKEGAGTLTPPAKGWFFTGGIDVQTGTFSMSGPVTSFFGKTLGDVSVASGAKASIAATDGIKYGEAFTLNGGTLELRCSGTAEPVTTYITNSVALNAGAKIRFDTSSLASLSALLSTDGFTLGTGVESAVSCAEFSNPAGTLAEASGENGVRAVVIEPVTAVWTGAANNNDFNDSGNWICTNNIGQAMGSQAAPNAHTVKYILAADADWTSTNLTLSADMSLDLNGHNLTVANITGSGAIVDLANDPDHTFHADANGAMYVEMEYLQTSGTYSGGYNWGNQYIDTGYHHNRNTVTEVKVAIMDTPSNNNWYCYYGSRDGYNDNQFGGWIRGTVHYKGVQKTEGNLSKSYTKGVPFITHLEQNGPCTIDGWEFDTGKGDTSGNLTDWLFAINHNGAVGSSYMAKARMYYCVIQEKDGENLVVMRNFRPVMRISDGKPGMLDIENGVFYVNARTGGDFLVLPVKKSSSPAVGSLTINVAAETTTSLANLAMICGNVKVVKAGAGTLTVPTTGVYLTGGIDVQAGALSITGPVTSLEDLNLGNITVASGAKATIPATNGAKYGEAFTLNGGTLELLCSGTATPVTTYITNSVALNAGAKIRFDTTALDSTEFLLSADSFSLGEGVESAVSCAELSAPTETIAEASGENGILVSVVTAPVTAVWTGAANNNDLTDPGNWSCTNVLGGAVSGTVPDGNTVKYILGTDADWTAEGAFTLATGVTLDLAGHNLTVESITGGGMVVDTSGNLGDADHNLFAGADGALYLGMDYLQSRRTTNTPYNWGSQYIDTGYRHNETTVVDMKVAISGSTSNWYCYYGSRTRSGAQDQFAGWIHGGHHMTGVANNAADQSWTFSYDVPFLVHLEAAANGSCSIDGHAFTHSQAAIDSGYNDYLFRIYGADRPGDSYNLLGRIYACTIKEGATVMRDFVPVKRLSDGKPGMLDREHGVFYVNGASTESAHDFTLGPVKKSAYAATGSVTLTVGENDTLSLANLAPICGNVKVIKAGAGTLAVPTTGVYFTGGIDVQAGALSIAGPVTSIEGSNLGNVTVASGAKAILPATDGLTYGEAFTLNGGTLELVCSGTAEPVTTYITDPVTLNAGAKVRFDTMSLQSTQFLLSTDGFTLGEGVESAVSCAELSAPTETIAEASGANGILVTVVTAPVTAVWTGAANNNDFNDPGNWSCTNVVGGALADTLPDSHTVNYILAVDADWSAATVTIPEGATLNMNGRRLKVTGLAGTGTITDAASGYLALEYLQGTGTQYIKTGYTMNSSSTADFKAQFQGTPANGHWHGVFGQRSANTDKAGACVFLYTANNTTTFWKTLNGDDNTSLVPAMNTDYTFHISKTGAASTVTGGSLVNAVLGTATTTMCSGDAYIFNLRQSGGVWSVNDSAKMRLYYLTFSENGTPVHDFVPARRLPDGVLGLYDKNNGAFLVNSGSGSFTCGNVKSELALNPVAGGELEVYAPEGQTVTINTVNITGSVKLVKTGLGTLVMAKAQNYLNGTEVEAGTIKPSAANLATPYGAVGSKISATANGTVDFNGNANMNKYVYDFADGAKALNGGAAISSGVFTFTSFYTPVTTGAFTASLADGATLDLTEWNGAWPIASVTAPAGATVTVKVDMDDEKFRTLALSKDAETGKHNGKLLSFGGARPADTAFVPDAVSANRCRFIEDENGDVILEFLKGFTLFIR